MFNLATLFTLASFGVATVFGVAIPRSPQPCDDTDVSTSSPIAVNTTSSSGTTTSWTTLSNGTVILDINGTSVNPALQQPPSGWLATYLEPYTTYHTRYLELDCEDKHNTTFFADCCHPLLATETLAQNRLPYCTPEQNSTSPVVSSTSSVAVPAPSESAVSGSQSDISSDDGEDCDDGSDDDSDDDDDDCDADDDDDDSDDDDDDDDDCDDSEDDGAASLPPAPSSSSVSSFIAPSSSSVSSFVAPSSSSVFSFVAPSSSSVSSFVAPSSSSVSSFIAASSSSVSIFVAPSSSSSLSTSSSSSSTQATSSSVPVAPVNVAPVPSPKTSTSASPVFIPKPTPTPTPTTSIPPPPPAPSSSSISSSAPSGGSTTYTDGFATFYTQDGVAGSCGTVHSDSDFICAMDVTQATQDILTTGLCGKQIQITNTQNGKSVTVTVADTCEGCPDDSIDLSTGAFNTIADPSEGRVPISWTFL